MCSLKKVIFFFLLWSCFSLQAQDSLSAFVQIRIRGAERPSFRLDSTVCRTKDTLLNISPGKHHLLAGAPKSRLIDTILLVKQGDTLKCSFLLKPSVAYLNHQYAVSRHRAAKNQRLVISPIGIAAFCGMGLITRNVYARKQYDLAMNARSKYLSVASQATMDEQKDDFEKYKKKYKTFKAVEYSMYAVSGALAINYVRIILRQKKNPPPAWKERELFTFFHLNAYPDLEMGGFYCGLTFTLQK